MILFSKKNSNILKTHNNSQSIVKYNKIHGYKNKVSLATITALSAYDIGSNYIDTTLKEPTECTNNCAERMILLVSKGF